MKSDYLKQHVEKDQFQKKLTSLSEQELDKIE